MDRIVRERERQLITGVCRATWRNWEKAGRAPARVKIGPKACGWKLSSLQAWLDERSGAAQTSE